MCQCRTTFVPAARPDKCIRGSKPSHCTVTICMSRSAVGSEAYLDREHAIARYIPALFRSKLEERVCVHTLGRHEGVLERI